MKASDIAHIPDPLQRMVQSIRFLRNLKHAEKTVSELRDRALLEVVDQNKDLRQSELARLFDVSPQRINNMIALARKRYGSEYPIQPSDSNEGRQVLPSKNR